VTRFTIGDVRLTRVSYFDVPLSPEVVRMTAAQVSALGWASPEWATGEGNILVGQAVWVIEAGGHTMVIDPCGAADAFLRTGPDAIGHQEAVVGALGSAGFAPDQVDTVLLSHLDGIGMTAAVGVGGGWEPFFPQARVRISEDEIDRVRACPEVGGAEALWALVDAGVVDPVGPRSEPAPGVVMEVTGGHTRGHAVVRIGDGAVFVGHLAISPVNVSTGVLQGAHEDPEAAWVALERELLAAAEHGRLLVGPLWPGSGAGHVAGPPWAVIPASVGGVAD
jgi:glyoxylase-like metal-dependent hydrolase (beta-lactamase superfamily II)